MAFTEQFAYTAGQTDLYAYPAGASYALSSTPWLAHRVLATEVVAGMYTVTVDESKSAVWSVFDGSAVPTSHDDAIATIRYEAPSVTTGTGARTVTITVTRNSVAAQGATVRLVKSDGSENVFGTTNSSGVVTFNVTDGTYSVAITHAASSFAGASLTVDGNETATYALTPLTVPDSTLPNAATGYLDCYDSANALQSGVAIYVRMVQGPGVVGYSFDSPIRKVVTGVNGRATFTNLVRGATYQIWRGTSGQSNNARTFVVPASGASFALPEVL